VVAEREEKKEIKKADHIPPSESTSASVSTESVNGKGEKVG